MLTIRVRFFNTGVLTLFLVLTACTDAMQTKTSHHVAAAPTSLTRRRHYSLCNTKNQKIYISEAKSKYSDKKLYNFNLTKNSVCTEHAPNEKDAMMSPCLDRKEERCTTWRVHKTGTGQLVETQDVFF